MSERFIVWDLETRAAPESELRSIEPVFEPARNLKDPEKITADIAAKRARWYADAALSPVTGRIFMAGFMRSEGEVAIHDEESSVDGVSSEAAIIRTVFSWITGCTMGASYSLVGFCTHTFDGPFLFKRALALKIPIPPQFFRIQGRYVNWPSWNIDLRPYWTFGDQYEPGTAGEIARFLGVGDDYRIDGKPVDGGQVAGLWANPATREHAFAKLRNDLACTKAIAERLLPSFPSTTQP